MELLKAAHQEVGSRIPPEHLPQLAGLPEQWRLCATGNRGSVKDCLETRWNSDPLKRYTALELLMKPELAKQCIGAGVQTGPASGGLLVLDFDEPSDMALDGLAETTFQEVFGRSSTELPVTATNTSGRRGRRKVFLQVPEDWWPVLGNWSISAGAYGSNQHAFEGIWLNGTGTARHAVIAGDHPKTSESQPLAYRWADGLHPAVVGLAVAPPWVLGGFIRQVQRSLAPKPSEEDDSFHAKRAAGEPQPCDLLLPKDQRRLLLLMQKHWPYRGAPADSPLAGSYKAAFRPLVAGLLNVLGKDTALAWLGGQEWDRRNDWADGNLGSFEAVMESLARSATDEEAKCGWGSIVAAAKAGGFEFPKWALPPRAIDIDDFTTQAAKKVQKLREALTVIDAMDSPVDREAAMQELTKIVGCKENEMSTLVRLMAEQDTQNGFTSGTTEELLAAAVPIRPCVERLLASGAVTMVASEGGVGKSVLIYRLAEAVATGGKFGGELQAVRGSVLVIQRDESASNAAQKLRLMGMEVPEGSIQWEFQWNGAMYPELRKWIQERKVRLVVMDSFGSLFAGAGAGMGEAEVGLHLYRLNQIASEEDCAIVLTHHLRKQGKEKAGERKDVFLGDLFGSSYIVNGASDVWGVIKDTESAEPKFKLKVLKPRSGITEAGDTFELLGCREDLSLTLSAHNGDEKGVEKARGQALLVLKALQGRTEETALDLQELAAAINGHPLAVGRVLKVLVGEKHPGLKRVPIKSGKSGRPSYRYWVEE
ncbi:MAG: AAA family ATPase [Cyanobium sp. 49614_E6]|nr:AAA family ATPase [Cyanobium sp. 49614_E6]